MSLEQLLEESKRCLDPNNCCWCGENNDSPHGLWRGKECPCPGIVDWARNHSSPDEQKQFQEMVNRLSSMAIKLELAIARGL